MTREGKRHPHAPTIHHGDCLEVLRSLPDASVDAVCTDPPYALSFMGKAWDSHDTPIGFQAWCQLWAAECLRVLKPGGHMLAFGGTRTWHRLACAVEDAGFEVRDSIAWMYGSGFPKSLDVSKAIDKAAMCGGRIATAPGIHQACVLPAGHGGDHSPTGGLTREVIGRPMRPDGTTRDPSRGGKGGGSALLGSVDGTLNVNGAMADITAPATDDARTWQGWGTALKPAFEPIVVARKPLVGTVAGNVLAHGTGALNIDGCRVEHDEPAGKPSTGMHGRRAGIMGETIERHRETTSASTAGRWPANVILDEDQANALDQQTGHLHSAGPAQTGGNDRNAASSMFGIGNATGAQIRLGDKGGASRFYYVAKAGKKERPIVDGTAHPTVKPLALMRWLVRLVTPPGGTVLEPFAGSGTTVEACILEGFNVIAIEREADYLPLIQSRIFRAQAAVAVEPEPDLFSDGESA